MKVLLYFFAALSFFVALLSLILFMLLSPILFMLLSAGGVVIIVELSVFVESVDSVVLALLLQAVSAPAIKTIAKNFFIVLGFSLLMGAKIKAQANNTNFGRTNLPTPFPPTSS